MNDRMEQDVTGDGIDRRGFLKCMAWVGTGVLWSMSSGGVLTSRAFGAEDAPATTQAARGAWSFVQISDSHGGFNKEPNKDVVVTFQRAIDKINALPARPAPLVHTVDLTHLAKAPAFE